MSTEVPRRYKTPDELTVEQHRTHLATGELPETGAYKAYVRDVLELAGIDPPDVVKPVEDMSVEDHLKQLRRR